MIEGDPSPDKLAQLERGIQLGHIREQPVRPLAHVVMGASDEAALYVAESADPARARTEMLAALDRLIDGISALRRNPRRL